MNTRTKLAALAIVAAPALAACGGAQSTTPDASTHATVDAPAYSEQAPVYSDPAHDACMGVAAQEAARISDGTPADFEGDYDLMGLCDDLVWQHPQDDGRVAHTVECVAEYVEKNIGEGGVFRASYADGASIPDLMDDPMSVGVCS